MQHLPTLSPTRTPPRMRAELAQRALGARVTFYTAGEPKRMRTGIVTFADIDTLHLLVGDEEGEELAAKHCRVPQLRCEAINSSFTSLNVWRYGEGWRGMR